MASHPYLALFGPPGVGKGTQASRLSSKLSIPHVSTGDIFRENVRNRTALGMEANEYMKAGRLVPDDLVVAIVKDRLSKQDAEQGFLLDGFPRTIPQAEALHASLRALGRPLAAVLNLKALDSVVIERISGRRLCKTCGEIYHVIFNPPQVEGICDRDGETLYQRPDDEPDKVQQRLSEYHSLTKPVLDYYSAQGLVEDIDGEAQVQAVEREILAVVRARCG